jgi:hypothetical protein
MRASLQMPKHDELTREWALEQLLARLADRWPDADLFAERVALATQSRAELLHAVGAQRYGNIDDIDRELCAYAFSEMTDAEQQTYRC